MVASSDDPRLRDAPVPLDQYPEVHDAVRTGRRATTTRGVALPILQQGQAIGAVVLRGSEGRLPGRERLDFVERLVTGAGRVLESQRRYAAMMRRAIAAGAADPLTGCASLDQLDRRLMEEFDRARRYSLRFSLVLLDIDGLEAVNRRGGTGGRPVPGGPARCSTGNSAPPTSWRGMAATSSPSSSRKPVAWSARAGGQGPGAAGRNARAGRTAWVDGRRRSSPSSAVLPEDLFAMAESALLAAKAEDGARVGVAA
jgi:hypothetical protein